MADIDIIPLREGDPIIAESLNVVFTEITNGFAEVPTYSLSEGALRHEQLPSFIPNDFAPLTGPLNVQTSHILALSPVTAVYDVMVVNGTLIELSWGAPFVLSMIQSILTWRCSSILILFNSEIVGPAEDISNTPLEFAIQWQDAVGTWHLLTRTERAEASAIYGTVSSPGVTPPRGATRPRRRNVSIRTLITADDVTTSIQRVRVVYRSAVVGDYGFYDATFTAIPFHAEML